MRSKSIYHISKLKQLRTSFFEMRLARSDFERAVKVLRDKYRIFPDDFMSEKVDNDESLFDECVSLQENNDLCNDVEEMLLQLDLPKSWQDIALLYVIDGGEFETDLMHQNTDGLVIELDTENTDDVAIHIGPDTTYEDYKLAWKKVQDIRGTKNQHIRKRSNVMRDIKIFILHKQGMSLPQICEQIDKEYRLATEDDEGISETSVRKIINEVYDRHNVCESDRIPIKASTFLK